jgi:hypothetical protein
MVEMNNAFVAIAIVLLGTASDLATVNSDQESRADSVIHNAESLAAVLRSRLPKGWNVVVNEEKVVIERIEPIQVFTGIGLPAFATEAKLREHIRPSVRTTKFVITLWLGDRLTNDEVNRAASKNEQAVEKARQDQENGKFMPNEEFWKNHPEYGFRKVPTYFNERHSVYVESTTRPRPLNGPRGMMIRFWDEKVEDECRKVFDDLEKLFKQY